MKIKNILALGLIAVVSGISTAQTYNATAGTNGTTDIQSDYSVATGDGASVSVDVPLEFELPKKVAIALFNGDTFTSNSLFTGIAEQIHLWGITGSSTRELISLEGYSSSHPHASKTSFHTQGAIYSNVDNLLIDVDYPETVIHETDPNSVISIGCHSIIAKIDGTDNPPRLLQGGTGWGNPDAPSVCDINNQSLSLQGESYLHYWTHARPYINTIDPTDRAGVYSNTASITISVL